MQLARFAQRLGRYERRCALSAHTRACDSRRCTSTATTTATTSLDDGLRVGVVGLGAIGSIFFTQLSRVALSSTTSSGAVIRSVDAFVKPHHIQQLKQQRRITLCHPDAVDTPFASVVFHGEHGKLVSEDGDGIVRIQTLEKEEATGVSTQKEPRIDVVLVALKAYDSARVIQELQTTYAHRFQRDATVVLLQNGLGVLPAQELQSTANSSLEDPSLPAAESTVFQFVNGVTYVGGRALSLGNVAVSGMDTQATYLAPMDTNGKTTSGNLESRLALLGEALSQAGLKWQILAPRDMQRILWRKLIVNAAINPIASVLNTANGHVGACAWSRRCVDGVVREAMAVAAKEGVDLQCTEEEMIGDVLRVAVETSANVCSTVADLRKGAKTEVDAITGRLLEYGRHHGVATPMNALLFDLVKALETQQLRRE